MQRNLSYILPTKSPTLRRYPWPSALVTTLIAGVLLACNALAETSSNYQSAVGVNLQPVSYFSSELPFLNIFKTAGSWTTHTNSSWDTGEEKYLNLDADGWPITLTAINDSSPQQYTSVGVLLLRSLPQTPNGYYPAGKYVVLYQGQGTLSYGFDAKAVSTSPGRDVIDVANPSPAGIDLRITSTDPNHNGNYIKNIQLVQAGNETLLNAGQVFPPTFLGLLKNFRALRFMDWFATNGSTLSSWSNRPLPSNAFWGTSNGVPLEVAIQLANSISADAWLNVPVMADNNYMTQMATLVLSQLGPSQKAYIELSNEVWNGIFSQNAYSITQGQGLFPNAMNKWYAGWEWYGMRVAQMSDIWYSVYGSPAFNSRVVMVMAGQGANPTVLSEELSTPDWTGQGNGPAANHHIGAGAIAPYFMGTPNATALSSMISSPPGGLTDLFATVTSPGGLLTDVASLVTTNEKVVAPFKIPLVAYEGGQALQGSPTYGTGSPQVNFFIAANRDPRMGTAYTGYLSTWKSNGGTLFMHYNDSFPPSQYGIWGLLESVMQTTNPLTSAPPKWQAVQNFIQANNCWWAACAGTISNNAPIPQAPSNLQIQRGAGGQ